MKLAVVRVRGNIGISEEIRRTLSLLNIPQNNNCTLLKDTPQNRGMLQKVKDYVTWGPVKAEALEAILPRVSIPENKKITSKDLLSKSFKELGLSPTIRLHPPRKGYKSVKRRHPHGDLGNRGEAINDLLVRMR